MCRASAKRSTSGCGRTLASSEVRFPERPAIPVSLYALVAALLVERWALGRDNVSVALIGFAAVTSGFVLMWARWRRNEAEAWGAVVCAIGAGAAALMVSACALWVAHGFAAELNASSITTWTFEALSDASPSTSGYRCRARAYQKGCSSGDVWLTTQEALRRGDMICGVGRYRANGDDDYGRSNRQQGVWGSVIIVRTQRTGRRQGLTALPLAVREGARRLICPTSSDERAVLAGIVLGDRSEMRERGLDELFATCGVAHLVAVSGSHIAVVAALLAHVLQQSGLRPAQRMTAQLVVTLAFVAVCGAPASAVRAWAMSAVASAGTLAGRRLAGTSSVCLVALAMTLVDPGLSGQLGFLLSVVCVIALCLYGSYASALTDTLVPPVYLPRGVRAETRIRLGGARRACVSSLGASAVAQAATLPLVGPVFACVSLVGPLSMLLVGAPLSAALALGLVSVLVGPLAVVRHAGFALCDMLLHVVLVVLRGLARVPYASVPLSAEASTLWAFVIVGGLGVLVVWPQPSRASVQRIAVCITLVVVVLVAHWRFLAPARVCVLDVGQGDAILIQDGPSAILVDAGPPDGSLPKALARNHVLHLDAVVLTHLHDDHYGGLMDLEGHVGVGEVIVAAGAEDNLPEELDEAVHELTGSSCEEISYHNQLQVGGFTLLAVWPRTEVDGLDNPDSLELTIAYTGRGRELRGLLTGDAEQDETGAVIAAGDVGDIDFLKVGHHGSEVSLTSEQAEALAPEVAVASAGEGNAYGHPRKECVEALVSAGARFLCTKDVGDVELRPGRDGVMVRTATSRR